MGAFHAAEVEYVFNNTKHNIRYSPGWPEHVSDKSDLAMSDLMSDYWVAFAKNGVPSVKGKPEWRPYTDGDRHYMAFRNGSAELGQELLPGVFELHEKIVMQRRTQTDQCWDFTNIGLLAPTLNIK